MQVIIGCLMIIGGAVLGLYVGMWVFFVGGMVDIIYCVQNENFAAIILAIGITKVVFAGLAGWVSASIPMIVGYYILD